MKRSFIMKPIVQGRNIEMTEMIHDYVNKKAGKLDRYIDKITDLRIELVHNATRATDDRFTAQLTLWADGQTLRAEESTSDILVSIDAVVDKMSRQIRRFKGRRYHSRRRESAAANAEAALAATMIAEEEAEIEEEEMGNIIRRKEFLLEPMDEQEALSQMEYLGHDFFIYYDVNAQGVNVVYRRRDGQFGLLQPRIG
jgi:putative sigma-54 modulation protein